MDEVESVEPTEPGRFAELPPVVPMSATVIEVPVDEYPFGGPEGGGDD